MKQINWNLKDWINSKIFKLILTKIKKEKWNKNQEKVLEFINNSRKNILCKNIYFMQRIHFIKKLNFF